MTADLYTRLRSAIEERLALAQAAWKGNGWRNAVGSDEVWTGESKPGHTPIPVGRMWNPLTAAFTAANDPAFVIRACRADLERLERHAPKRTAMEKWMPGLDGLLTDYLCAGHDPFPPPWPCPEVRSLAEVYEVAL